MTFSCDCYDVVPLTFLSSRRRDLWFNIWILKYVSVSERIQPILYNISHGRKLIQWARDWVLFFKSNLRQKTWTNRHCHSKKIIDLGFFIFAYKMWFKNLTIQWISILVKLIPTMSFLLNIVFMSNFRNSLYGLYDWYRWHELWKCFSM